MRTLLPHARVIVTRDDFTESTLGEMMHQALATSEETPCALEVHDQSGQRLLFFRERQVYAAVSVVAGQFESTSIREFMLSVGHMSFPQAVLYQLNVKILHSLLVLFQKKPVLRVLTSLVDLDELLDNIETEGKSCIVSASHEDFVALLRYEKGNATACCHELSAPSPQEGSFRDDFLVKIYTISTEQPVTISLFEDLMVSYAEDAKNIPAGFDGSFEELYLSKPPIVVLRFKDKEISRWKLDKPELRIGRTPDNDVAIDNLGVSRLHAVIEEKKGSYFIRDCDSLNGTVVNGRKVGRAELEDGDQIHIGKHTIVFRRQEGRAVADEEAVAGFDRTMIIDRRAVKDQAAAEPTQPSVDSAAPPPAPKLIIRTRHGNRVIELGDQALTIGRGDDVDIVVDGFGVAGHHAEITREDDHVVLRRLGGLRRVKVDGKAVKEIELKDNAEIVIAKEAFIFQE